MSDSRPQRSDARTNRARILEAADAVFGEDGESASTEEVARRAGVGIATVFRHFPTKVALLEAVLAGRFDRLRDYGLQEAEADDPGKALFDVLEHMASDAATKIVIADALIAEEGRPGSDGEAAVAAAGLDEALAPLLRRAQENGTVRTDVGLPEIYALIAGTSRAVGHAGLDRETQARILAIVFDGLHSK